VAPNLPPYTVGARHHGGRDGTLPGAEGMRKRTMAAMRTFHDTSGAEWTVFEVRREPGRDIGYLPQGFNRGWLCFECAGAKRRLTPVPEGWARMQHPELEALLERAAPVRRSAAVEDVRDSMRGSGRRSLRDSPRDEMR
jgi:hypothetical protein